MKVRFELTARLAELAGFREGAVEVPQGRTLRDALGALAGTLSEGAGGELLGRERVHPSVLVVVDGCAVAGSRLADTTLTGGETIQLMLPVAGG
ncbi:MAG TPA: MoaD/ThiS family protein [bacterium]|nr:MoaD/ThiS family protein [bacterium]